MNFRYTITCLAVAILMAGCGSSTPNGVVSGKVTFEGEPVTEGSVLFVPQDTKFGGEAPINADGSYSIKTQIGGLPPGKYLVAVQLPRVEMGATKRSPGTMMPKEVDNIPKIYRSSKTSGLEIQVPAGGVSFDIAMKKK
ncbi:carboxypeptidase-like regulatory domain-containing protein [Planctomicrobium sp. SH668]|uniref:carboxypeptidase-like regulatory domain-containing protein n=1 Tax=Planctomicrobium sp. SH668 TaxID=3448126 RepID=UPI003F5BB811